MYVKLIKCRNKWLYYDRCYTYDSFARKISFFIYFPFPQVTSYMADQCSFLEPMARLTRGSVFIDFFHFYEKDYLVEDPSENRLKQYNKTDFYPFRSCSFMGFNALCPNRPWKILRVYFKTDNFKPIKLCKNGSWLNN